MSALEEVGEPDGTEPSVSTDEAAIEPTPADFDRFDCTGDDPLLLAAAVEAARLAIERGECIVFPTDTVYGVGADAFSPEAVQLLLDAKNRDRDMPPPVLIADSGLIRVLALDAPQAAKDLVAQHWPGPLTVICKAQPSLRMDLGEAEGTIALRVPDHELARELLRGTGPMAVSSANLSGQPAAVTCEEAIEQLGDRVSVYLDGGRVGSADVAPSTIVDFSQSDDGEVLRNGALSFELLRETCPELKNLAEPQPAADEASSQMEPVAEAGSEAEAGPEPESEAEAEHRIQTEAEARSRPAAAGSHAVDTDATENDRVEPPTEDAEHPTPQQRSGS